MKKVLFTILIIIQIQAQEPWAHTYKQVYSEDQMRSNRKKETIQITRDKALPFTQLVFSWNAHRPKRGVFTFYVRVKDQTTQAWDTWHKMIEWGSDIQKSNFSRGKHSVFNYARLEMNKNKKGDGFQVKVMRDGKRISFSQLKLSICVSLLSCFPI